MNYFINIFFSIVIKIINFIKEYISNTYLIFFKNIFLYFYPIEIKLVYDNILNIFDDYKKNVYYDPERYIIFYKINNIIYDNKKIKFYNYGYYYHCTSVYSDLFLNKNTYLLFNNELADCPDTIEYINITMIDQSDNNKKEYVIKIHDKLVGNFISSILIFSTKQIKFDIILYYYLQHYLNNYDKISKVKIKFELDDDEYEKEIDHSIDLDTIYKSIE
jgi:hypothetical protein